MPRTRPRRRSSPCTGRCPGGTAVLESGAWVLRIARNECMGRLRQTARRPAVRSLDDGFETAGGGRRRADRRVARRGAHDAADACRPPGARARGIRAARVARLRDERGRSRPGHDRRRGRRARDSRAPEPRASPWAGSSRRSAAPGRELRSEAGSLDRAAKVHLLRCPVCRGVRRALRPPRRPSARIARGPAACRPSSRGSPRAAAGSSPRSRRRRRRLPCWRRRQRSSPRRSRRAAPWSRRSSASSPRTTRERTAGRRRQRRCMRDAPAGQSQRHGRAFDAPARHSRFRGRRPS